jgi:hypothetical protein
MGWMHLAQGGDQMRAFVKMVMMVFHKMRGMRGIF